MDVPQHIAIIMDGNGRWAKKRGLPRTVGHKRGAERVKEIIRAAKQNGVSALTLFAFSTENWSRPKSEIHMLFSFMIKFLQKNKKLLLDEGICFNVIGRRDRLGKPLLETIKEFEAITRKNHSLILTVALDYGGRWDILQAAKHLAKACARDEIDIRHMNENTFKKYLSLANVPEPDLLIRTSGELRISNFLLWQTAYSELYFTDTLWPDFDAKKFKAALEEYSRRRRRFGRAS